MSAEGGLISVRDRRTRLGWPLANDHVVEHLEGGESDSGVWKGQVLKPQGKERKGQEGAGEE